MGFFKRATWLSSGLSFLWKEWEWAVLLVAMNDSLFIPLFVPVAPVPVVLLVLVLSSF